MQPFSCGPLRVRWVDRMLQADFLCPDAMPIRLEQPLFLLMKYDIPYSTLQGRLQGRVSRPAGHLKMLVLTEYEENAIVRWCERLDEWGHPARLGVVKSMAEAIVAWRIKDQKLGKNWINRFLIRHPSLATKLSSRLDCQWALPVILLC